LHKSRGERREERRRRGERREVGGGSQRLVSTARRVDKIRMIRISINP
jgi:hypothetical protein